MLPALPLRFVLTLYLLFVYIYQHFEMHTGELPAPQRRRRNAAATHIAMLRSQEWLAMRCD